MKILVTADLSTIDVLLKKPVSGLVFGLQSLSQRVREPLSVETLEDCAKRCQKAGKEIYVNMNALIEEDGLGTLEKTAKEIVDLPVDGILFADLAVYEAFARFGKQNRLMYYPETYVTSPSDVEFWSEQGIQSVVLSRELTLSSIEKIAARKTMPLAMIGHGYLNMFHSKRRLIKTFFDHTKDRDFKTLKQKTFTLVEELREDPYPIYQDVFGTHIFRSRPLASFKVLDRLQEAVDVFLIDTLFYEASRIPQIVDDYAAALESPPTSALLERYEDHDDGFLFQETSELKTRGDSQ